MHVTVSSYRWNSLKQFVWHTYSKDQLPGRGYSVCLSVSHLIIRCPCQNSNFTVCWSHLPKQEVMWLQEVAQRKYGFLNKSKLSTSRETGDWVNLQAIPTFIHCCISLVCAEFQVEGSLMMWKSGGFLYRTNFGVCLPLVVHLQRAAAPTQASGNDVQWVVALVPSIDRAEMWDSVVKNVNFVPFFY